MIGNLVTLEGIVHYTSRNGLRLTIDTKGEHRAQVAMNVASSQADEAIGLRCGDPIIVHGHLEVTVAGPPSHMATIIVVVDRLIRLQPQAYSG